MVGEGIQESDIRLALQQGGRIDGVFVVERHGGDAYRYAVYIRPSWRRRFFILRTFRDRGDREFRDPRLLLRHLQEQFGYNGPVTIYRAGHVALARFRNLAISDQPLVGSLSGEFPVRQPDLPIPAAIVATDPISPIDLPTS